jgi:hypothetical protein
MFARILNLEAALIALAVLMSAAPFAQARTHDAARSIIIYGGYGYFDKDRLPWLDGLIRRDAKGRSAYPELGQQLEASVRADAEKLLALPANKWSDHGVVFGSEDLARAYGKLGGSPTVLSEKMLEYFDNVYVLVLAGGFEHFSTLRTSVNAGLIAHTNAGAASVSASLIDLRQQSIVLSTFDFALAQRNGESRGASDTDKAVLFAEAYRKAAGNAIGQLARLAVRTNPARLDDEKLYMVTGFSIPDREDAREVARLFEWSRSGQGLVSGTPGSYCDPPKYCRQDSAACMALSGYLISATSRSLSEAGYRVLPPQMWKKSARSTGDIAQLRLELPDSALVDAAGAAEFAFDPASATYKVIAFIAGTTFTTKVKLDSPVWTEDFYGAAVAVTATRTMPTNCKEKIESPFQQTVVKGLYLDTRPTSAPVVDDDPRRVMLLRAINAAASNLSKELR